MARTEMVVQIPLDSEKACMLADYNHVLLDVKGIAIQQGVVIDR